MGKRDQKRNVRCYRLEINIKKGYVVKIQILKLLLIMGCSVLLSSCSATQSRYIHLSGNVVSRPAEAEVLIFKDNLPDRPYQKVSRIDVHLEKSHFVGSDLDNAIPLLKKEARMSGAEAIIEIREKFSRVTETKIYHVTAIGILFTDK